MSGSRCIVSLVAIPLMIGSGCSRSADVDVPQRLHLEITGHDFEWHVRNAGRDEILGTDDDCLAQGRLTLLAGADTTIDLKSHDYLYSFALPHLRLKEIAVPDLTFTLRFAPNETGEFLLQGDQMCGFQHPKLLGRVQVLAPKDYLRWLRSEKYKNGRSES